MGLDKSNKETEEFPPQILSAAQSQVDTLMRGVDVVLPDNSLLMVIAKALAQDRPLLVKAGFDPTAPHLHLGHSVLLHKLRQFQKLGHRIQFLVGDFTARIGDPTGRSETRKPLTDEQIIENAETYKNQVFKVLDAEMTDVVYNSKWFDQLSGGDWLRLASQATVAQMLERDDFSKRYKSGSPIGVHEFFYPLLQGHDSVELNSDVELGGTDQRFNLLFGRELQKQAGQKQQIVVMLPILEGLDGVQKMSKSLGNAIGIDENPAEIFGKLMSISDDLLWRYIELLADDVVVYQDLKAAQMHPMDIKKAFAREICTRFADENAAKSAQERFETVHQKQETPDDIAEFTVSSSQVYLPGLLVDSGMAGSRRDARDRVSSGACSIDGEKVTESNADITIADGAVVKFGKKQFRRIRVQG